MKPFKRGALIIFVLFKIYVVLQSKITTNQNWGIIKMLQYIFNVLSAPDYLNTVYFRCFMAFFVALILALSFGDRLIKILHHHQLKGQPIREDGPQSHLLTKKGTPTMGGFLILGSVIVSLLLCAELDNPFVWVSIVVLAVYGLVGFTDDYLKVTKQTANAMTAKMKLLLQFLTALGAVAVISYEMPAENRFVVNIPYVWNWSIDLLWFYIPFAMVVITGSSNAVNLSDGLDGLASWLLVVSFAAFGIIAYACGTEAAEYFYILPVAHAGEMAVACAAVAGGCLGFLWFNAHPAKVFMGDTGSLALGAFLGTVAVMVKQELLLVVIGGVFVMETVSVMLQVFWFRRTGGRRLFKMAPIHHHFEQLGWPETKVVSRFVIIAVILAVAGLMSLQIR